MMLHTRRTRTYSNQSFTEKDPAKHLQRGSVQSINTFSLRRLLGSAPSNHSSNSWYSPETSNSITQTISKEDPDCQLPSAFSASVETMSEPLLNLDLSPGNPTNNISGDSIRNPANGSDIDSSLPAFDGHSASIHEQQSETLPASSAPTTMFHRSIFTKKHHAPLQTLGNKASTILRQNILKENQMPKAAPEQGKLQRRPASSPAPPGPAHLRSLNLVIPDRQSSLSPPHISDRHSSLSPPHIPDRHSSLSPPHIPSALPLTNPITSSSAHPPSPTTLSSPTARSNSAFPLLQPSLTGALSPPPPPLTLCHYACYQFHRHMCFSRNIHNPVPCMTCGVEAGQTRWKCCWCCLRICESCMEEWGDVDDRNLTLLMKRLAEGKVGVGRVGRPRAIMVKGRRKVDERNGEGGKEELAVGEAQGKKKGDA